MTNLCVFCNSAENLNTSMTVSLDDTSTTVSICDACADEATPKRVKEAYATKKKQIDEVMAQARALGLDLTAPQPGQKIQVIQQVQPQPQPQLRQQSIQQPVPQPQPAAAIPAGVSPLIDDEEGPVISTAALLKPMQSVGGSAEARDMRGFVASASVPVHQSHNLRDELGSGVLHGKAKITMVEGRDGMPLQLPSIIQDGTGTTRVRVRQQLTDATLQRRFKSLGHESRWDRGADFRNGYETETERQCPICRGSGTTRNFGKLVSCPKCSGTGIIIV